MTTSVATVVLGAFGCLAIPVILLPQFLKILRKRSSQGMSFFTFGICTLNGMVSLLNVSTLNEEDIRRCFQESWSLTCTNKILMCVQTALMFSCYAWIYMFCIFYYCTNTKEWEDGEFWQRKHRRTIGVTRGTMLLVATLFFLPTLCVFAYRFGNGPYIFVGEAMGHCATLLVFWQWVPQIIQVTREKDAGTLSALTFALMAPASLLMMFYLSVLSGQHYSTWISYLFSAIQQLILLVQCLYYGEGQSQSTPIIYV